MSIGKKIRDERIRCGFTQSQLADLVGLSTITIRQYEADKREPRYQIIEKLARVLNCSVSKLVDSRQQMNAIVKEVINADDEEVLSIGQEDGRSILDIWADAGIDETVSEYAVFVAKHPYLMGAIKEMGIQFTAMGWHEIRVQRGYEHDDVDIGELLSDLESLHKSCIDVLRRYFIDKYEFDMDEEE